MAFFSRTVKPATTQDQAIRALQLLKELAGRNRRTRMQKRVDYYFDKQEIYLEDALKDQFKNPDRMKLQKEFYNLTELIVQESAIIYNEEPIREILEGTEKDTEIYTNIVEESGLNQVMQQVNQFVKLCKTVAVRPVWRDGHIKYDIFTPNIYDVYQDKLDTTKAIAYVWGNVIDLNNEISDNNDDKRGKRDPWNDKNNLFYYMDEQSFIVFSLTLKGKNFIPQIHLQDNNPEFINPYGVLPFVTFWDGVPVDEYFLEGGDGLIATNEIINVKLTEGNFLTKMQSFSIPVRKGVDDKSGVFSLDPSLTVDLPGDTDTERNADFKFATPDAKIKELDENIDNKIRKIAIKHNLSPERFTISAQKSSAEALQLRAWDQAKILKADKPFYARYEKQLFEMTKIVWNTHNQDNPISDTAKLFIDYKEVETPMTVEEEDNHNIIMHTNGLISKKTWLMRENPDIKDEEQAEKILDEIRREKQEDINSLRAELGDDNDNPPEDEDDNDDVEE